MLLNGHIYIQRVLWGTSGEIILHLDGRPTIFELIFWLHPIEKVTNAIADKTPSVKLSYRYDNIMGMLVHRVCSTSAELMRRVGKEALSIQILL